MVIVEKFFYTLLHTADDITQFQTIVTFGSGSAEGDIECVEIFATSDNLMEGNEILFLVLFPLPTETTPFTIDSGRMIALLTILNSKREKTYLYSTYSFLLFL